MKMTVKILSLLLILPSLLLLINACGQEEKGPSKEELVKLDSVRRDSSISLVSLNKQIAANPDDYGLYQDRSELYFGMDSLEKAVVDINKAIELYRNGPDLYFWKGFLTFILNDTVEARKAFEIAEGLGSQNPEVYYQLGQIYFFQKRYEDALRQYKEAAEYQPDNPIYVFAQGFLEEERKRYKEATLHYLNSLKVDPAFDKSLLRLHDIYLNHYENELEALKYNKSLLDANLGHPLANYNEGNYQLRRAMRFRNGGDLNGFGEGLNNAIANFTIAVNNDENFALAHYARGMAYFEGGQRMDAAIEDFQKTIEINPNLAQAHFMLGSIFEGNGDLSTALGYFKEAARLKPDGSGFQKAVQEVSAQLK
ncbi:MAG: tetratricopeptide repeat protein [Bacteroidota bacterium]